VQVLHRAVGPLEPGSCHATVGAQQLEGLRRGPDLTLLQDPTATEVDVLVGVEGVAAAEPEDGLRVADVYAEGADPFDTVREPVDQGMAEFLVPLGEHLVDHRARGCRPGVAREQHRAAEVVRDLDHENPGTVGGGTGSGGEAGHPASQDQEVDGVDGVDGFRHGSSFFGGVGNIHRLN
jgi:hypothetical protein